MKAALKDAYSACLLQNERNIVRVGVGMDCNWTFFRTVYTSDKFSAFTSTHVQPISCAQLIVYTFTRTFTKETKAIVRGL